MILFHSSVENNGSYSSNADIHAPKEQISLPGIGKMQLPYLLPYNPRNNEQGRVGTGG